MEGSLTLGFIAVVCALAWHELVRKYSLAVISSVITTMLLSQVAVYIQLGYVDPYFGNAMLISGLAALVISAIIGLPFLMLRKMRMK